MATQLSLNDFKATPNGRTIAEILGRADTVRAMEELSRSGRPAVLAIDRALAEDALLDEIEKRHVGRWVRDVLADRGWRPRRRAHFRSGRFFGSGAVYERPEQPPLIIDSPPPSPEIRERIRRVQEMMRPYIIPGVSIVDELIAERRAEAARELDES